MSRKEKAEINELPEKYRPMGAWGYWAWSIIYSFPILGFIFVIVNSFRSNNVARRNHARSYLCAFLLVALLLVIAIVILHYTGVLNMLMSELDKLLKMS